MANTKGRGNRRNNKPRSEGASTKTKSGSNDRRRKNGSQSGTGSKRDDYQQYRDGSAMTRSGANGCVDSAGKRFEAKNGANDISWYSRYPELLASTASIPYPYRPGMALNIGGIIAGYDQLNIPGVMSIPWLPTIGFSQTSTDPASVVAKQIYSQVRKVYSGSLEADAPDYVMYIGALSSVFAYIAWAKRVYRCTTAYSPNNYALPDVLLAAMGFNPTQVNQLRSQKVKLWNAINTLVYSSRKFTCPAVMDIINRHYWLSDNVYADANSINAQFYLFNPLAFYQFTPFAKTPEGVDAGGLAYVPLSNVFRGPDVVQAMFDYGNELIETLVTWDESYTISGYLARAYEGTPQFVVDLLAQDEQLMPVYNEEVLTQIENSRGIPGLDSISYFPALNSIFPVVTQDPKTNAVINTMTFDTVEGTSSEVMVQDAARTLPLISLRSDLPTVADTVIATRMTNTWSYTQNGSVLQVTVNAATEIVGCPRIWYIDYNKNKQIVAISTPVITISSITDAPNLLSYARGSALMSQFDWCPGTLFLGVGDAGDSYQVYYNKDLHNVTTITSEQLADIHRVCLFSEFNAFNF